MCFGTVEIMRIKLTEIKQVPLKLSCGKYMYFLESNSWFEKFLFIVKYT